MYGGLKMENKKFKEKIEALVKNCGKMLGGKNEKTVIQFDNEKRRRMGFLQMAFVAVVLVCVILIFYFDSARLNRALIGLILGYGFLLQHYIKVLDKENAGLVISSQGILFNGTELGREIGLIAWEDIETVERGKAGEAECLFLRLKNPEKYTGRMGGENAEQVLREGLGITTEGLQISFEDMERTIHRYSERTGI
jgi:hypothetical protein